MTINNRLYLLDEYSEALSLDSRRRLLQVSPALWLKRELEVE